MHWRGSSSGLRSCLVDLGRHLLHHRVLLMFQGWSSLVLLLQKMARTLLLLLVRLMLVQFCLHAQMQLV